MNKNVALCKFKIRFQPFCLVTTSQGLNFKHLADPCVITWRPCECGLILFKLVTLCMLVFSVS